MTENKYFIEEEQTEIKLRPPKFNVDEPMDVTRPLPATSFYLVVAGAPRSGKTSLVLSLLRKVNGWKNYHGKFWNMIVCMPTPSRSSIKDNIFDHDDILYYDELDSDMMSEVLEFLEVESSQKRNTLLIIDDQTASLKNGQTLKQLNSLVQNRRHLRLSIIMICQYYNSIPLTNRKQYHI